METIGKEKAFSELLDILAYAHEKRIMHRDIKPENIIITSSGTSKLLDFGTGKDLTLRTTSSTVVGSRPYMAPEQIAGKSSIASDVWALGVLLYALATGLLPFYDENQKKLMDMILECDPEPPRDLEPELPEELEEIILKCLRKDPDLRFRDAGELKRILLEHFPHFGNGATLPPV
jgi:serine/threonine protein kinase